MTFLEEVQRRRTFAIISHPDAGKTTLTEKLLLYGGAIHLAGSVKSRKTAKHAVSDWMEIEKQRGISVTSSVLRFDYDGCRVNILDTPGHQDFSEDTYRTLMAADSAVMLIDVAKGVEAQTKKLFAVSKVKPSLTPAETTAPSKVLASPSSIVKLKAVFGAWVFPSVVTSLVKLNSVTAAKALIPFIDNTIAPARAAVAILLFILLFIIISSLSFFVHFYLLPPYGAIFLK